MIAALANASLMLGEPSWIDDGGARLRLHRARDDARRPARPFLARRPAQFPGLASDFAAMIRAALALHEATGAATLSGAGAGLAARARPRTTPMPSDGGYFLTADDAEGLVVRPAATSRRRDAQPQCASRRKISSGSRCSPATITGATRPTGCSRRSRRSRPTTCSCTWRCSMRIDLRLRAAEIVVTGRGRARRSLLAAARAIAAARSHRAARALGRRRCRRRIRRTRKIDASLEPQAFVCVGETCSLPVTDAAGLARALEASRQSERKASKDQTMAFPLALLTILALTRPGRPSTVL